MHHMHACKVDEHIGHVCEQSMVRCVNAEYGCKYVTYLNHRYFTLAAVHSFADATCAVTLASALRRSSSAASSTSVPLCWSRTNETVVGR